MSKQPAKLFRFSLTLSTFSLELNNLIPVFTHVASKYNPKTTFKGARRMSKFSLENRWLKTDLDGCGCFLPRRGAVGE